MAGYSIQDLIDVPRVQQLLASHCRISGMACGLMDENADIILAVGLQEACQGFHWNRPQALARCWRNAPETRAALRDLRSGMYHCRCLNGMYTVAMPVIIDSQWSATFFAGQFYYDDTPPDHQFLQHQALEFGFDPEHYLAAVRRIPVLKRSEVEETLQFLHQLVQLLADMGLKTLHLDSAVQDRTLTENRLALTILALDLVHEAAFLIDQQGRLVYVNQEACRALDYARGDLIGMAIADVIPDGVPDRLFGNQLEQRVRTFESIHRTRSGHNLPVEIAASVVEYGGTRYTLALARDITERKRLEMSLRASEETFRSLAENSPDHIMRYDRNGCVTYINPQLEKALSTTARELVGTHPATHEERFRGLAQTLATVLQTGRDVQIEVEMPDQGKGARFHLVSMAIERDHSGDISGVLAIGRDITERKRMEDTLRFIASRGWMGGADSFLTALARYLGESCAVDYVVIGRYAGESGLIETVALFARGEIVPNVRYALRGTPCENVVGRNLCFYPEGVRQMFPEDVLLVEMGVESYAGIPLWDTAGEAIGLIAVLDGQPLPADAAALQVLQLVAGSAAAALITKRDEEALQDKQRRLNDMTLELSLAEERERRAIAAELHDRIGQDLTLARIKLGMLAAAASAEEGALQLKGARELLEGVIRSVRTLTHRISPPILESGSLEMALKWLARQVEDDYGLRVQFHDDGSEKDLSGNIRVELYNAVRELLHNVAKHAATDSARVAVGRTEDWLYVRVEDDGAGFDTGLVEVCAADDCGGFGLFNVRRRIVYLGGVLRIDSAPGRGCRVAIEMPLARCLV